VGSGEPPLRDGRDAEGRRPGASGVVALFGPTGTGKTDLACEIADRIPCRLISCDAVQVYRELLIATAKPQCSQKRHPWALVDVADPRTDFDLGRWVLAAEAEVARAAAEGRVPLVVGGTGLYLRGLLKGVAEASPRDPALRRRLEGLAARRGAAFLHRVLTRLDPAGAGRLMPNDRQRLVRALEVVLGTGRPLSALHGWRWRGPDRFPVLRFGLSLPREELCARLDVRVETFFRDGLIDEVRWLIEERRLRPDANALKAIGYREVARWLLESQPWPAVPDPPRELIALVQRNTRRYAKRQMTWFRKEQPARWLDPRSADIAEIVEEIREFRSRFAS